MKCGFPLVALALGLVAALGPAPVGAQIVNPGVQSRDDAPAAGFRLYDRTQIIVRFRDGVDPNAVMAEAMAGDLESYRPGGSVEVTTLGTGAAVVDLSPGLAQPESSGSRFAIERDQESTEPLDALIARLNADPRVEYAQKNYVMRPHQDADFINSLLNGPSLPNDEYVALQWHLAARGQAITETTAPGAVNFPEAWLKFRPQRNVVVAVVDTGQLYDHEDVDGGILLPGYDFVSDAPYSSDGDGRDPDATDTGDAATEGMCYPGAPASNSTWHGSHVSGILGAALSNNDIGIAGPVPSNIRIVPVRALGICGGTTVDLAEALMWAAGIDIPGVPSNPNPATVINASFGGYEPDLCRPLYREAIEMIRARGAVVVVSAGNDRIDVKDNTPANCDGAFTVAAADIRGHLAYYSNFGAAVDILAPGGDTTVDIDGNDYNDGILSTVDGGYAFFEGTSMAAPVVAAAMAMALAHHGTWTVEDAMARIQATALPRTIDQCQAGCGAGLLDVPSLLD